MATPSDAELWARIQAGQLDEQGLPAQLTSENAIPGDELIAQAVTDRSAVNDLEARQAPPNPLDIDSSGMPMPQDSRQDAEVNLARLNQYDSEEALIRDQQQRSAMPEVDPLTGLPGEPMAGAGFSAPQQPTTFEEHSYAYSSLPPEMEAQRKQYEQDLLRQQAEQRSYSSERMELAKSSAKQAVTQRRYMQDILEKGEKAAQLNVESLARAYDQADKDVASIRVDPRRWEKDTPALAQVLMALGSSAFAFFTQGRGVNPIIQLIDRAIDRDMDAQMQNVKAKLGSSQMKLQKEEHLGRIQAALYASMHLRAQSALENMLASSQDQDGQLALAAAYKEKEATSTAQALQRLYDFHAVQHKVQQTPAMQAAPSQNNEKLTKSNNDAMTAVTDVTQNIDSIDSIIAYYNEAGGDKTERIGSAAAGYIPLYESAHDKYEDQKGLASMALAKATTPGQVSDQESARAKLVYPLATDDNYQAYSKFATMIGGAKNKLRTSLMSLSEGQKASNADLLRETAMKLRQKEADLIRMAISRGVTGKELQTIKDRMK
jgi:hypothetical protein